MLFVVSGPSGCGKSTLIQRVLEDVADVHFSVSHTTRIKRGPEVEGKDYYFVPKEEFLKMAKTGKFVEWAEVHGHCYGTSQKEIARKSSSGDLVLDIDVQGARQVKKKFKKVVFIFVIPPEFKELKRRLEKRGQDNPAAIAKRLENARREIRAYPEFEYLVVNDDLERAAEDLKSIILASRCRLESRKPELQSILQSFSK